MRWLALAVSLIASVILIIHNVIVMLLSPAASSPSVTGLPGNGFTMSIGVLLISSAILALIGGILAFNRRRLGGFFLVVAAVVCFFAHRDTRIYGALYLVGGILSFFVKRSSPYENYDDDYEEDDGYEEEAHEESDEPDSAPKEPEDFRGVAYGVRRRERASRIARGDRKEYVYEEPKEPEPEKVRVRSTKVCPACGASVGVDHKFCFICGGLLHTVQSEGKEPLEEKDVESILPILPEETTVSPVSELPGTDSDFRSVLLTESLLDTADREREDDFVLESKNEAEGELEEEDENGDPSAVPPEITAPHKVFVKPQRDEQPIPRRPVRINPDNSYQEFSNYTRRRKRRNQSLPRRILGMLLLLLIVGGVAWFLLGLRRVPGPLPVPQSEPGRTIEEPTPESLDIFPEAKPIPGSGTEEIAGGLPSIQIADPRRGVVIGSNVNIRSDHSTAGSVVTRLSTDARAEVLDAWQGTSGTLTGPWYQIRTNGKEGWIYGQYFQLLDARDATLPQGYTAGLLKTFGSGKTEMTNQLGQPSRRSSTALTWSGLVATFKGDNEVTRLQITTAKHTLKNGVVVGMPAEALYKSMGFPSEYKGGQLRYLESPNHGMSLRMKDGKIQSIIVGNI